MDNLKKWNSRKLFVAVITLVAIVLGIQKGDAQAEADIINKGSEITDLLIAGIGGVYILAQGIVDAFKK